MAEAGHFALLSALILSSCAIGADLVGEWRRSPLLIRGGRDATVASFACLCIAMIALIIAFTGNHPNGANIASPSLSASSSGFRSTKPWPGNAFFLLFWLWALTGIVSNDLGKLREDHREFCANARVAANLVIVFFLLVLTVEISPFAIFGLHSPRGVSLDPLGVYSPVPLFGAYAYFAVLLAWSFAWLKLGNAQEPVPLLKQIHRRISGAWFFLTFGEVLSAVMGSWLSWRQASFEGGWLRYVPQNISLTAWLPATALLGWSRLHKRNAVATKWIVPLSLITFSSCILTTFVGRPDMPAGARRLFIALLICIWALGAILVWRKYRRSHRYDETLEARCDN